MAIRTITAPRMMSRDSIRGREQRRHAVTVPGIAPTISAAATVAQRANTRTACRLTRVVASDARAERAIACPRATPTTRPPVDARLRRVDCSGRAGDDQPVSRSGGSKANRPRRFASSCGPAATGWSTPSSRLRSSPSPGDGRSRGRTSPAGSPLHLGVRAALLRGVGGERQAAAAGARAAASAGRKSARSCRRRAISSGRDSARTCSTGSSSRCRSASSSTCPSPGSRTRSGILSRRTSARSRWPGCRSSSPVRAWRPCRRS